VRHGVEGLQARHSNGDWIDVSPQEGTLAVNFGRALERWRAGRIKATEHRVFGARPMHTPPLGYSVLRFRLSRSSFLSLRRARP
jgi:isopenicillin N synthase-like dioxygenase